MNRYHVNLVVEVVVSAEDADAAASAAELRVQSVLDRRAKSLKAIVGADYGDVTEAEPSDRSDAWAGGFAENH